MRRSAADTNRFLKIVTDVDRFSPELAFSISIAYSGLAAGALVLAPLSGLLIESGGWRWTYQVLGLSLAGLAVLVALLPWGRIGKGIKPPSPPRSLIPDLRVLRQIPFWGLFCVFFMTFVV